MTAELVLLESFTRSIKAPAPTMTGTISGNAQVCFGSSQTYTIPAIANATDLYLDSPFRIGQLTAEALQTQLLQLQDPAEIYL